MKLTLIGATMDCIKLLRRITVGLYLWFQHAMDYHRHPDFGLFWIFRSGSHAVQGFRAVQDNVDYWGHRGTHGKFYSRTKDSWDVSYKPCEIMSVSRALSRWFRAGLYSVATMYISSIRTGRQRGCMSVNRINSVVCPWLALIFCKPSIGDWSSIPLGNLQWRCLVVDCWPCLYQRDYARHDMIDLKMGSTCGSSL